MPLTESKDPSSDTGLSLVKFGLLLSLLAVVLGSARWYQQSLAPDSLGTHHDCDLQQGSCNIKLGTGILQVDAGPLPLRSLNPLNLTLQFEGEQPEQITAELQGAEMYMGINRFELNPDGQGNWYGKTELAVCTTGTMRWQLLLMLQTDTGPEQHLFEFNAR